MKVGLGQSRPDGEPDFLLEARPRNPVYARVSCGILAVVSSGTGF
jgi:hypothetical protein